MLCWKYKCHFKFVIDDRAYKVEGDNTKFTPPDESLVDISPPDDSLVQNKEVEDDENLSNDKIDLDPSEDKMIGLCLIIVTQ